jgi:peptidoglycan/xylan/chitin deacetylase (PgdA/CDA1 family)
MGPVRRVARIGAILALVPAAGAVLISGGLAGAAVSASSPAVSSSARPSPSSAPPTATPAPSRTATRPSPTPTATRPASAQPLPTTTGTAAAAPAGHSAAQTPAPPARGTAPARTIVTFAWGGGNASQMPSLPLFRQYGMHATYYIPSGLVCFPSTTTNCATSQYLTLADIRKIAAAGNEIGGLTVDHLPLETMPTAEVKREICNDRVNLTRWGFTVTDFAYPYATARSRAESLVRQCGYNSGLGAGQVAGAGACTECGVYAETIPPQDPMVIRAPVEVNASDVHWTPATFESIVTAAQQHGGGWVVFLIHDICRSYCTYGITGPQLRQVLSWVHQRTGPDLMVETVRQVIGGPVRPAVPGPVPPRIGGTGIVNADLAEVGTGGYPACFQPADYGANAASFSYHRGGGPGGAATETVSMTSEHSGDAKLLQETDLGECAPPASPGHSYVIGGWYRSSVPAQFDLYYRNQIGDWAYWTSSTHFAASAGWKHATWTTPAAPPGTTALSFGLALSGVGQLTTTGYSLAAAPPDHTKTVTIAAIVLAIAVPIAGWRIWRPRHAGTGRRSGAGPAGGAGGRSAADGAGQAGLVAGRRWMAGPAPAHQMVIIPPDEPITGTAEEAGHPDLRG